MSIPSKRHDTLYRGAVVAVLRLSVGASTNSLALDSLCVSLTTAYTSRHLRLGDQTRKRSEDILYNG